jgi:predicted RNA methylase
MAFLMSITTVNAKTINRADSELCETLKMALINRLRVPVDKAIVEIYKNDKNAPNTHYD